MKSSDSFDRDRDAGVGDHETLCSRYLFPAFFQSRFFISAINLGIKIFIYA